ncbi:hypothetical protein G4B88_016050 [Cannabis sativa]|uniref:Uncharacterized protein n=1 Tax=Cannabis sativa TaxID=3483 RepID=A0A7J6DJ08_CANSA|nr:hypothetical protein G4B88_016050 [Cannabis sativa]
MRDVILLVRVMKLFVRLVNGVLNYLYWKEACVQARNERRDLAREGNEIICEACKWSPELSVLER